MPTKYVFADEAGCFTFKRHDGASKFFLLCTVAASDCSLSAELLEIRRTLAAQSETERDKLHATSDKQEVRDKVFAAIQRHKLGDYVLYKPRRMM